MLKDSRMNAFAWCFKRQTLGLKEMRSQWSLLLVDPPDLPILNQSLYSVNEYSVYVTVESKQGHAGHYVMSIACLKT